jgi:hypothetical protein
MAVASVSGTSRVLDGTANRQNESASDGERSPLRGILAGGRGNFEAVGTERPDVSLV